MTKEYRKLLVKMFIVESLGERIYDSLRSKSKDADKKSVYAKLSVNEKETRDAIEKELESMNVPVPKLRTRCATGIADALFWTLPERSLLRLLTGILKKRAFSHWRERHNSRNPDLWTLLLEHENLQWKMLDLSE